MPYSIEAEESLLGNIMLYPEAMRQCAEAEIKADDFYLESTSISITSCQPCTRKGNRSIPFLYLRN